MSNTRTKQLVSFSIDKTVLGEFKSKSRTKKMNMSKWIEERMKEFLKSK